MNRLRALDATFLYAEDGTSHLHIGSCAVFAGPAPSLADVRALIESKLHLVPRFRQKVRFVPASLAHPVWVDDPAFDLAHHVERAVKHPLATGCNARAVTEERAALGHVHVPLRRQESEHEAICARLQCQGGIPLHHRNLARRVGHPAFAGADHKHHGHIHRRLNLQQRTQAGR